MGEQEHALPTQGESLARTADIQSVNDSVRNRSDTQVEQQTQELKKHKHVSEQRRKEKKNITDKLKYESVDNQNDVQQEPEQTLPIEGESQAKITDIHPINDQFKTGSVRNQSNIQSKQQRRESKKVQTC